MKKILAIFAVIAVSSYGSMVFAASGDAAEPKVKGNAEVYGQAKLSVDMIDTGATAPNDSSVTRVSSNSSRLGFKGTEDLGDGLSTVYQVELGINLDGTTTTVVTPGAGTTSVNTIGLRNSFVGLKSATFGTVYLGTHDTPYKSATGQFDAFADSMGDYNAIIGNINGAANLDRRPGDAIGYISPVLGGVQVSALTSEAGSEAANRNPDARLYSVSAEFKADALVVNLAYEIHKNLDWGVGLKPESEGTKLGAGYTIGGTKIGLVYESIKNGNANSKYSRGALYASVAQTIGKEKIKLAYGSADDGDDPTTKTGATMMAVGFDHIFSKRTTAYVLYAATKNEANATYGLGQSGAGGAYAAAAGKDPSVLSFGVNHSF